MLTFKTYQEQSNATAGYKNGGNSDLNLAISTLGLAGEAGEVSELIKKFLGHGKPLDKQELTKELGDVLWYIADTASQLDISLEDIAQTNLDKLAKRYPEGFTRILTH